MNILLTGASGFVGQQVLHNLLKKDVNIFLVLREGKNIDWLQEKEKKIKGIYYSTDIFSEDIQWWKNVLQNIDIVIHVAWYAEPGKYLQSEKNLECLKGSISLTQACKRSKVKRFIGIGTCFEYDLSAGYLSVETPLLPNTLYAVTKASLYTTLSQWLPDNNIEFCWCRLFYLYGENEDERRLVPYLRAKLVAGEIADLTSGEQVRDFLDVGKAGQIIVDTSLGRGNGPVNVCSGLPITVRQLAEKIADEYNARHLLNFGARPDNPIDPPCVVGIK